LHTFETIIKTAISDLE